MQHKAVEKDAHHSSESHNNEPATVSEEPANTAMPPAQTPDQVDLILSQFTTRKATFRLLLP